jgi:hypothetical protein
MQAVNVNTINLRLLKFISIPYLPQCLSTCDISTNPDIDISVGSTARRYGNPTTVLFDLSHDIDYNLVPDVPCLKLTSYSSVKFNDFPLTSILK